MIYRLADNITSPLGDTTRDNVEAVRAFSTALSLHQLWDMPEPFMGSLFPNGRFEHKNYKTIVISSIREAISHLQQFDDKVQILIFKLYVASRWVGAIIDKG